MDRVRVLIDTDLGDDVDDAAALVLALSCSEIEITGVTTVFKDTKKRARMVRDLLNLYGREDIPVCPGYGGAIVGNGENAYEEPIQYGLVKGSEQEIMSDTRADDFIIHMVKEDRNLIILAMGAMTNLAMAFLKEPELMREVKIIGMGGNFMNSSPEWNILCDPEAASIVMEKANDLIMMGLDVTKYLRIDGERLAAWKARADGADAGMRYYLEGVRMFQEATGFPVTFHDVLLVAYLMDPLVVTLRKGKFAVELSGKLTRGTMVDLTNYYEIDPEVDTNFRFAQSVDLERFYRIVDEYF